MNFTTNKRALARAVARVLPLRGGDSGVLIEASHDSAGEYVTVAAGDGTVAQTVRVPATVRRAGSFTADAPALRKALSGGRAADTVTAEADDETRLIGGVDADPARGRVWIGDGSARHAVEQAEAGPFPVEIGAGGTHASWASADLSEALRRVAFAMSAEETRYYLNGVFVTEESGGLVMVATDGHRLACTETPLAPGALGWPDGGIILPALAVAALAKASAGPDDNITVRATTTGAAFAGPGWEIETRAIDGTFPDYQRVFPAAGAKGRARVTFDLGAFGATIRAAKPTADETILLNGYPQIGNRIALDCGPAIEGQGICFKARYVADMALAIGGMATMDYDPANREPALFLSPDLPGFAGLLMPFGARR